MAEKVIFGLSNSANFWSFDSKMYTTGPPFFGARQRGRRGKKSRPRRRELAVPYLPIARENGMGKAHSTLWAGLFPENRENQIVYEVLRERK